MRVASSEPSALPRPDRQSGMCRSIGLQEGGTRGDHAAENQEGPQIDGGPSWMRVRYYSWWRSGDQLMLKRQSNSLRTVGNA